MDKKQASRNWLKILLIVENVIIIAALFFGCMKAFRIFVDSYEENQEPLLKRSFVIHSYPDKLTYVAGQDTELDLSGGKLCLFELPVESPFVSCVETERHAPCEPIPMEEYEPLHTIDFSEPGMYVVSFKTNQGEVLQCGFPVEVIAPEALLQEP